MPTVLLCKNVLNWFVKSTTSVSSDSMRDCSLSCIRLYYTIPQHAEHSHTVPNMVNSGTPCHAQRGAVIIVIFSITIQHTCRVKSTVTSNLSSSYCLMRCCAAISCWSTSFRSANASDACSERLTTKRRQAQRQRGYRQKSSLAGSKERETNT